METGITSRILAKVLKSGNVLQLKRSELDKTLWMNENALLLHQVCPNSSTLCQLSTSEMPLVQCYDQRLISDGNFCYFWLIGLLPQHTLCKVEIAPSYVWIVMSHQSIVFRFSHHGLKNQPKTELHHSQLSQESLSPVTPDWQSSTPFWSFMHRPFSGGKCSPCQNLFGAYVSISPFLHINSGKTKQAYKCFLQNLRFD